MPRMTKEEKGPRSSTHHAVETAISLSKDRVTWAKGQQEMKNRGVETYAAIRGGK